MLKKRMTAFMLGISVLSGVFSANIVSADTAKDMRTAYIHTQKKPTETVQTSTVYKDDEVDVYFAIDDANKGDIVNGEHTESQYDLNGYTLTIYYDDYYFDLAEGAYDELTRCPIDYTVPGSDFDSSGSDDVIVGDDTISAPADPGYYVYPDQTGYGTMTVDGKEYKAAYITVFFSGDYLPQKPDDVKWYNLCKLPLVAKHEGSTKVFFDTSGDDDHSLKLFAKNKSGDINEQTFKYSAQYGGYHTITIKDKTRPPAPTANPPQGSYTKTQYVELLAESGCDIYYSLNGGSMKKYTGTKIEVAATSTITCYAQRGDKKSNEVSFEYKILPETPHLFIDTDGTKKPILERYDSDKSFRAYITDGEVFGEITPGNDVYYTYTDLSTDKISNGNDPETSWVWVDPTEPYIDITQNRIVRLVTKKGDELSYVAEYELKIKPQPVKADKDSGEYESKFQVSLSCDTEGALIYYTIDGTDPSVDDNGILYYDKIYVTRNTQLRAVALLDGIYSDVTDWLYTLTNIDENGVDAYHNSGAYEGEVDVTLTPRISENSVQYSIDNGRNWLDFQEPIHISQDTVILAKAGNGNTWGDVYEFKYKIKPIPPKFVPATTDFSSSNYISIYCPESYYAGSDSDTTSRYCLYYTLDGTDPTISETRIKADENTDSALIEISKYTVINAVVLKDGNTYSTIISHSYDIVEDKPFKPNMSIEPGRYSAPNGYVTIDFDNVGDDMEIWYTVSDDGEYVSNPIPNTDNATKYDGKPFQISGQTIVKAVCVDSNGTRSDMAVFDYVISTNSALLNEPMSLDSTSVTTPSGDYNEVSLDDDDNYLYVMLSNEDDLAEIQYRLNGSDWSKYTTGDIIKIKGDRKGNALLQTRTFRDNSYSLMESYVYYFFPLSPIMTQKSGRYTLSNNAKTQITYSENVSQNQINYDYRILWRVMSFSDSGNKDTDYTTGYNRSINETMSVKSYVKNNNTGRLSKNAISYYIVNTGVDMSLKIPQTSLGTLNTQYLLNTTYTILDDYPESDDILIFYTLNGSNPNDENNTERKLYNGEILKLTSNVTVKTVYARVCGECNKCKNNDYSGCTSLIYGNVGEYKYTVYTPSGGGSSGGGGGHKVVDNTRKFTKDIFGNEHPTHISYISGYPDGSVMPNGLITREEITSILYRITNHEYENPFVATGGVFPDVYLDVWSTHDIEYMASKNIVTGYPDGEFKPQNNLSRAEFAALIARFANLEYAVPETVPADLDGEYWAYNDILSLISSGLMEGYEDGTYRCENSITRAEVMTVINKLLGRNPLDSYVKTLEFTPYTDLDKNAWYYTAVLEATVTHDYYLNDEDFEFKWENCK